MPPFDWDAASPHPSSSAVPVERFLKLGEKRDVWFLGDVVVRDTHYSRTEGSKPCRKQAGACELCEASGWTAQQNGFFPCLIRSLKQQNFWVPCVGVVTESLLKEGFAEPGQRGRRTAITRVQRGTSKRLLWEDLRDPRNPTATVRLEPPSASFDVKPHVIRAWFPMQLMPAVDDVPPPVEIEPGILLSAPVPPDQQAREDRATAAWKIAREAEKRGEDLSQAFAAALVMSDAELAEAVRDAISGAPRPAVAPSSVSPSEPNPASGANPSPVSSPVPTPYAGSLPASPAVVTEKIPEIISEPVPVSAAIAAKVATMDDAELASAVGLVKSMPALAEAAAAEQFKRRASLAAVRSMSVPQLLATLDCAAGRPDMTERAAAAKAELVRREANTPRNTVPDVPGRGLAEADFSAGQFTRRVHTERVGGAT